MNPGLLPVLSAARVDPDDIAYIDSLTAQRRMIEAGLGVALIEQSSIEESIRDRRIATIAVTSGLPSTEVFLAQRLESYLAPAATALIERFQDPER